MYNSNISDKVELFMSPEEQKWNFVKKNVCWWKGGSIEENFENLLGKDIDFEEFIFGRNQSSNYKCSGPCMD